MLDGRERRRYERMSLNYKVFLNYRDLNIVGVLNNISACGASFTIDKDEGKGKLPAVGETISFVLASDTSYLKFVGTLIRCDERERDYTIAVTFY